MCDNLTYDPELGDTEVRNNRLCCEVPSQIINEFLNIVRFDIDCFAVSSGIV
jgi:hypothetical protein